MPIFNFRAKKESGEEISGVREAENRFVLAEQLKKEGYIIVFSEEQKEKTSGLTFSDIIGRIPITEKMLFARNLAVMVGAGVSLTKGLEVLSRQTASNKFRQILLSLQDSVSKGEALSQGMKKHPKIFSKIFIAMVRAGEESGNLEESLKLISQQLEKEYQLIRKIKGALLYPAIIIAAMVIIAILMLIFVVPTLVETFDELGVELPLSTRVVVGISTFIIDNYIFSFFALIILIGSAAVWISSKSGKRFLGTLLIKFPLFAELTKEINAARTARTLGSLIGSGVEILSALKITEEVIQNHNFKEIIKQAQASIQKGDPISKVFIANADLYPVLVGEMMAVGEETGKLSDMLFQLAIFYEEEVSDKTSNLSTIIEPILMIIIGVVVGFFAISMITPMYSMVGGF